MTLATYNSQLKRCGRCRSSSVEIITNENAVGVMCNGCGNYFTFENSATPLADVVEWWNKHFSRASGGQI